MTNTPTASGGVEGESRKERGRREKPQWEVNVSDVTSCLTLAGQRVVANDGDSKTLTILLLQRNLMDLKSLQVRLHVHTHTCTHTHTHAQVRNLSSES